MKKPIESKFTEGIDYDALAKRLGEKPLQVRLDKQKNPVKHKSYKGMSIFALEHRLPVDKIIKNSFKATGLYRLGYRNYLNLKVRKNLVRLKDLPEAFEGFRILQIADLHCDLDPRLPDVVIDKIRDLEYDICVNTGDFRNSTYNCQLASMESTTKIYKHVNKPSYAVLGNHDFIEKVQVLEKIGIRVLLNESLPIKKDGQSIWLAGVDDPHLYRTHDLKRALKQVPKDVITILLSHSPEIYKEVAQYAIDMMMSGHTHGGQICLPGGIMVTKHADVPNRYSRGAWKYRNLLGYTSRGTGASTAPLRFNCRPEVTIHKLVRK